MNPTDHAAPVTDEQRADARAIADGQHALLLALRDLDDAVMALDRISDPDAREAYWATAVLLRRGVRELSDQDV